MTCAMRKPQFSEQLPERFPELMGTHMEDFHLPMHSRSVFLSKIGVVTARQIICCGEVSEHAVFLED